MFSTSGEATLIFIVLQDDDVQYGCFISCVIYSLMDKIVAKDYKLAKKLGSGAFG